MQRWGVIADDVTGACDVAAELFELGLAVSVMLGVPDSADVPRDVDAVVVGLGTRTAPRERAVADSLAAAAALTAAEAGRWYHKYCSTFDSTDQGMIGPVAEALADAGGFSRSVGTPATPHSDRTVYRGHLFVGDRLLSESPLATHPITPVTDSDLVRVLGRQSTRPVTLVDLAAVHRGTDAVRTAIEDAPAGHVLVDALGDGDLDVLAEALDDEDATSLPGGGAGLITALGRRLAARRPAGTPRTPDAVGPGPALVLAGSASARSREQLDHVGGPTVALDAVHAGRSLDREVQRAVAAIRADLADGSLPVVSAGHDPDSIATAQRTLGIARAAEMIEAALAGIAVAAVADLGVRRVLVAGGESSGAVTQALGVRALRLTRRVDPGVAWATGRATTIDGAPVLAVLLKSGNFGGADLFERAWTEAP